MSEPALIGMAALTRRSFAGEDLTRLAVDMLAHLEQQPTHANVRLDLAVVLQLLGHPDMARVQQQHALARRTLYHLAPARSGGPRLLALMRAGDLMANTPLPFLLEGSDVALDMLYFEPGRPLAAPDHDVLFNAMSLEPGLEPLMAQAEVALARWPRPVINPPAALTWTARDQAYVRTAGVPGFQMAPTAQLGRVALDGIAAGTQRLSAHLPGGVFPLIIRPLASHAGHGLERLGDEEALGAYLARHPEPAFYVSRFQDYRSADGYFRKYRVAVIDGRSYPVHMAISEHWMVHYLNAGMDEHAWKRDEEAAWMAAYEDAFGRHHHAALAGVAARTGLDYLIMDCTETPDRGLLAFEFDPGGIVHAMDPPARYPYKGPAMAKLFTAFQAMVRTRATPA